MTIIRNPDALKGYKLKTLDFEDLASFDGRCLQPTVVTPNQIYPAFEPYENIGLTFTSTQVDAHANLASASGGVALESTTIYTFGDQNFMQWQFGPPQSAVGFYCQDNEATDVKVSALASGGSVLEETTFQGGIGYIGFIHANADIFSIQIFSSHTSANSASESRTYIDDLSFASSKQEKVRPIIIRGIKVFAWAWTILIGYLLFTPVGPVCISCSSPMGDFWIKLMGIGTIVLAAIGLWRELKEV